MSLKFNVFTGTFDFTAAGSTPASSYAAPYNPVPTGYTLTVREFAETLIFDSLYVDGSVEIDGTLIILPAY